MLYIVAEALLPGPYAHLALLGTVMVEVTLGTAHDWVASAGGRQ